MAKKKSTYRSKIPPPSWDQVAWLGGLGVLQLAATAGLAAYTHTFTDLPVEELTAYHRAMDTLTEVMFFVGVIGVSAIALAGIKTINLLRMRSKKNGNK